MIFFFFKQKTAYEMRISDWSSDVCSSDLGQLSVQHAQQLAQTRQAAQVRERDARVSRPKPGGRRALASTAVPPSAHRDGISKYLNEVERTCGLIVRD